MAPPSAALPCPRHEDADVPLIWRTTDGGKTWTSIVNGLPADERTGSWVNILRADPEQPGLLFAGTETTVYVSFDNGDHWQSLRQNLPSTSIRDLVIHTDYHMNDLVIGTYGRGFWVLDDITPLRQISANAQAISSSAAYLFAPEQAIRARLNSNWDQPFSVEVPHAPNPPYGAIVDYYLSRQPSAPIQLQVFDAHGNLVRTMSSTLPPPIEGEAFPRYWLASPESRALSTHAGLNRVNWNLNYDDPPALRHDLENEMNMVPGRHHPRSARAAGNSRHLYAEAHRRRPGLHPQRHRRERSARRPEPRSSWPSCAPRTSSRCCPFKAWSRATQGHEEVDAVKDQLAS